MSFEQLDIKSDDYLPLFFNLTNLSNQQDLAAILRNESGIVVYDQIKSQICELIKCQHPSRKLSEKEIKDYSKKLINGFSLQEYGNWVYYPWSRRLVHILPEKEFGQLRSARNNFKITPQEQDKIFHKM